MKVLIQGARIIDPGSSWNGRETNVLINKGRIQEIGEKNFPHDQVVKARGMVLSAGWLDLGTSIPDPGLEHKEDLQSGAEAAMQGGFTELAILPNTSPAIQSKNEISYVTGGNPNRLVQIHALAAVTKYNKGEELTEMIDLHHAGAVGFTDGLKTIWHTDIVLKSLQYLQKFGGLLIDHPEDIWLNMFGQMHEGVNSTMLGLKGLPRIAEDIIVNRNLELLGYAGGRLHFSRMSSGKAFDLIRTAKKRLNVTCDIAAYQPLFDDSYLHGFDSNFKVNPPFREKSDNDAIIKALKDGTIDVICSAHLPQDEESKNTEFDAADFGIINLQTFAANLAALSKSVDLEILLPKVTQVPRKILGLTSHPLEPGEPANLTLFSPGLKWRLDESTNCSRSRNSPWWGKELEGRAVAVFNNDRHWIDPSL
jgi:dihydroorotase